MEDGASADLTALGMRLEILRIQKGLSKQGLARTAGTSRQQLWRVMTGKSELTSALKVRLAGALACETEAIAAHFDRAATAPYGDSPVRPPTVSDYLTDAAHIATTLKTLPLCDDGRRLKRALLNTLEDMAVEAGRTLPAEYPEIHRQVLAGEL